jgi:hypothetical protein
MAEGQSRFGANYQLPINVVDPPRCLGRLECCHRWVSGAVDAVVHDGEQHLQHLLSQHRSTVAEDSPVGLCFFLCPDSMIPAVFYVGHEVSKCFSRL